ncbi:hypothetical protein GMRT_11089 [Giardia muris]|uniref:Uncharacterized protein n=1 Tax=Giardia muris TaxID=5742 RepID=A0A4Z1SX44_GIAMU|nr:hypothetical protein GMRT_11089 [Giardia muris]|eukprot:TNJ30110.1 hypothetical protein GMRT_11089 [Giardia muris]
MSSKTSFTTTPPQSQPSDQYATRFHEHLKGVRELCRSWGTGSNTNGQSPMRNLIKETLDRTTPLLAEPSPTPTDRSNLTLSALSQPASAPSNPGILTITHAEEMMKDIVRETRDDLQKQANDIVKRAAKVVEEKHSLLLELVADVRQERKRAMRLAGRNRLATNALAALSRRFEEQCERVRSLEARVTALEGREKNE